MKDKGHFWISATKSAIRMIGSFIALVYNSIEILAWSFLIAEILGVLEEIVDKR